MQPHQRRASVGQFLRSLPDSLRQPIEQLRLLQKKCDELKEDYNKELKALNAKYKQLYGKTSNHWTVYTNKSLTDPIYDNRARIIKGRSGGETFTGLIFCLDIYIPDL